MAGTHSESLLLEQRHQAEKQWKGFRKTTLEYLKFPVGLFERILLLSKECLCFTSDSPLSSVTPNSAKAFMLKSGSRRTCWAQTRFAGAVAQPIPPSHHCYSSFRECALCWTKSFPHYLQWFLHFKSECLDSPGPISANYRQGQTWWIALGLSRLCSGRFRSSLRGLSLDFGVRNSNWSTCMEPRSTDI